MKCKLNPAISKFAITSIKTISKILWSIILTFCTVIIGITILLSMAYMIGFVLHNTFSIVLDVIVTTPLEYYCITGIFYTLQSIIYLIAMAIIIVISMAIIRNITIFVKKLPKLVTKIIICEKES